MSRVMLPIEQDCHVIYKLLYVKLSAPPAGRQRSFSNADSSVVGRFLKDGLIIFKGLVHQILLIFHLEEIFAKTNDYLYIKLPKKVLINYQN